MWLEYLLYVCLTHWRVRVLLWEILFAYRQVTSVLLLRFHLHNLKITSKIPAHESPPTGKSDLYMGPCFALLSRLWEPQYFTFLKSQGKLIWIHILQEKILSNTFWQKCDKGRKDWRSHNLCESFMVDLCVIVPWSPNTAKEKGGQSQKQMQWFEKTGQLYIYDFQHE